MKRTLIILFLLFQFNNIFSQVVNVDPYSGKATTTIPIWTIKSGPLSFPIFLYNTSGGIKVDDYSGTAGVGWGISTSSSIVRDVRGLPDDYSYTAGTPNKQGWLVNNTYSVVGNFVPTADDNLLDCTDEEVDFNFLNSLGGFSGTTMRDTEPDIYSINVPGLSGSFTFDNAGQIAFITKQDYKITYMLDGNGAINSFRIVNESGIVYNFGNPNTCYIRATTADESLITNFKYRYFLYKNPVIFNFEWKLVSIESSNGEKITFEYQTNPPTAVDAWGNVFLFRGAQRVEKVYASVYNKIPAGKISANVEQYTVTRTDNFGAQFKKIYTRSESVEGIVSSVAFPTGDYTIKQPALNNIIIYDQSTKIKTFNFAYKAITEIGDTDPKYLLLRSVTEASDYAGNPPYVFDYYGVDFQTNTTLSLASGNDEYSFLNSGIAEGSSSEFKIFAYPFLTGIDKFRNKPVTGYTNDHYESRGLESSSFDLSALTNMSLKQVTLPGGGVNRIFYEPNYYRDALSQADYYGGGLRVKRLEIHDGIDYTKDIITNYKYQEDDGTSSGVLLYRPLRTFILNSNIDLLTGVGTYYNTLVSQGLSAEEIVKRTTVIANGDELNKASDPGIFVGYRKVTVSQAGAGRTEYEFDTAAPFGTQTETGWTATRNKIARDNPDGGTPVTGIDPGPVIGYYAYPFAPDPNYSYKRGLLKRITAYDNTNNLVKQTENEYVFLSNPTKVYALKLDQYKALLTFKQQTTTVTGEVPMFIYSRYEINTNVRSRLSKTTTKIFDQVNPASYMTNVQSYEYTAVGHDLLTRSVQTGSDGAEYATNYKYPSDYTITGTWAQQDNATKGVVKLKDKNIIIPVETWTTKKEGTETPAIIGASLNTFEYDAITDNLYLKKSYSLATRDALASFLPSYVNNTGSASIFTFENTKYNTSTDYLNQDAFGNSLSSLSFDKSKSSMHKDVKSGLTKAVISNALADQVVFSDFESTSGYDFTYSASNLIVAGRVGGKGLNLLAGSTYKLSKLLNKGDGLTYTFSCWINTSSTGILTIRVSDAGAHTQVSVPLNFTNTNGVWKYFSTQLATNTFNSNITVEAESNIAVNLDDVLFYPTSSDIVTNMFGKGYTKIAETNTQGISQYYEYDPLGRLLYQRDQDQNIIKSYQYNRPNNSVSISTISVYTSLKMLSNYAYLNTPTVLSILPDYPGATYKVKIVKLEDHQANPNLITDFSNAVTSSTYTVPYTFTQNGKWVVNVQITYQGTVMTTSYYTTITVTNPPLAVTICANRPSEIDLCNLIPLVTSCDATSTNNLILKATVSNGTGPFNYQWSYDGVNFGTNSTSASTSFQNYANSHVWKCTVTTSDGAWFGEGIFEIRTYRSDPNCTSPNQN